jgi:hypothetical protein
LILTSQRVDMPLPNFLIVGAPKAGTTSLARLLSRHPEVFFSRPKETRFFSRNYTNGIDYYERTFFAPAMQRLVGEGDVTYLCHPCVPQRIEQDLGAVKIIVLLRNPVDRFWSGYLMGVHDGRFTTSPEELLKTNLSQLDDYRELEQTHGAEAYDRIPWRSELLQNGHYGDCLANYFAVFERKQILVLIFEDLLADPEHELRKVFHFLQIEPHGRLSLPQVNTYRRRGTPRLLAQRRLRRLLPSAVARRLFDKPPPAAGFREQLEAYYSPQIVRTEELLGVSLSAWRSA